MKTRLERQVDKLTADHQDMLQLISDNHEELYKYMNSGDDSLRERVEDVEEELTELLYILKLKRNSQKNADPPPMIVPIPKKKSKFKRFLVRIFTWDPREM